MYTTLLIQECRGTRKEIVKEIYDSDIVEKFHKKEKKCNNLLL
uniref:Uncharacterized protein n=1 Tax=Rhizophora mucronata TaxID=61149 RepID=A0A2P2QFJ4_RHIMU